MSWSFSPNAYSQQVAALQANGIPLLDLSSSNPTGNRFDYPHRAIAKAFGDLSGFEYAPDAFGEQSAREAVAAYYHSRNIAAAPDRILLTASTSEGYSHLFKLLCDPGDEVVIPTPSYPLFEYLAALESVRTVPYRLRYDGSWHIDFATLVEALSPRTRAIVIVNPNNPTGSFLKQDEAQMLLRLAAQHRIPVIADEVFLDYSLRTGIGRVETLIGTEEALVFSLSGLSKAAGMPQMKAGWIVVSGPSELCDTAVHRLELILDTYLSVNTPVQKALGRLFEVGSQVQEAIRQRTRANMATLKSVLAGSAANPLHTEGGWSAIVKLPRTRSEDEWLVGLLEEHHVIAQPGYFYDMPSEAYLVLSLLTECGVFEEGAKRLKALVSSL